MTTWYLAYFPSPPRGVWYLGPVPVRAYALFIIVGIVVALLIGDRRWAARGGERGVIYDIALWAVPFGLLGGRLYHLCTDWRTYFGAGGAGLNAALRIWDGGLGIWGAVALGGVGAWIACRRRKIPLAAFGDAVAPGIVLAQAIGRLGNYFNQELFGRETTMPWGLEIFYRRDPSGYVDVHSLDGVSTGQLAQIVQPTFLYEMLWNLFVFGALLYLDKRFVLDRGRLFATYVAAYCVGRFTIELLRDDAATHIAGIRINSFTSTFVFIGAVVYIILVSRVQDDPADPGGLTPVDSQPLPVSAARSAAVLSGTRGSAVSDQPADSVMTLDPEAEAVVAEAEAVEGDVAYTEVLPADLKPAEAEVLESGAETGDAPAELEVAESDAETGDAPGGTEVLESDAETVDAPADDEVLETDDDEVLETDVAPADDEVLETVDAPADDEVLESDVPPVEAEVIESDAETGDAPADDEVLESDAETGDAPADDEVLETDVTPADDEVLETGDAPVEAAESPPEEPAADEPVAEPSESDDARSEASPAEASPAEASPAEAEPAVADMAPEGEPVETPVVADETAAEEPVTAAKGGGAATDEAEAAATAEIQTPDAAVPEAGVVQDNDSFLVRRRWWRRRT
jgi:prolipoprotein diacylglyceryl transferase